MVIKDSSIKAVSFKLICLSIIAAAFSFFYIYFSNDPFFLNRSLLDVKKTHDNKLSTHFQPNIKTDLKMLRKEENFLQQLKQETLNFIPLINNNKNLFLANIDVFNNIHLLPRLKYIVSLDYFRFVKLNLNRKCELWSNNLKCSLRDCRIEFCDESKLPPLIKQDDRNSVDEDCSTSQELSKVNETMAIEHVETLNSLFECYDPQDQEDGQYIDLLLNPESYTGYRGEEAHKIWRSIYEENCFLRPFRTKPPFSSDNLCYEEKIFYRAISGLHTSINVHLSALYLFMDGSFTYNKREFVKRFQGHLDFLKNLYFLYLLELRAIHKAELYLLSKVNWQSIGDGNTTREAIKDLLKIVKTSKWHFNESVLFDAKPFVAKELAQHFNNITTHIMNCVACDKCRLWGKVQTHGLGTAFKILLTENIETLHLHRHEIITLINAFTRLSNSINFLDAFNKLLKQDSLNFKMSSLNS